MLPSRLARSGKRRLKELGALRDVRWRWTLNVGAEASQADHEEIRLTVLCRHASEIKSGVAPMTGQNAVVDAPAIEREATPIV
jgi:hypothetical protein